MNRSFNTRSHMWSLYALALLGVVLFFANTWGYDLWPADEPRFGEVAREMMLSHNYLVPHCNGVPYKEKPPLLPWGIVAASLPFGEVNEFSARVPSGLAGLVALFFTYLLTVRLYDRRTALFATLILMTMGLFWSEARSVRCDMLLTACLTALLYFFQRWHTERRIGWLVAMYAALAAGLYAKGPPALIFPLLLLIFFYRKKGPQTAPQRKMGFHIAGMLCAVLCVFVWFVSARMAIPASPSATAQAVHGGIGAELYRQIIGRMFQGAGGHAEYPWYYLLVVPAFMFPWTLFLPWTIPWVWKRRRENDAMRLLLSWSVPAFIFFSICIGKREVYLLPIYPVLAILVARSTVDLTEGEYGVWRKRMAFVWGGVLLAMGLGCWIIPFTKVHDLFGPGLIAFSCCALLLGLDTLRRAIKTDMTLLHVHCALHFAVLAMVLVIGFFPVLNPYRGASAFCSTLRTLAESGVDYRLYSIGFSREEFVFYARHFHEVALDERVIIPINGQQDATALAKQEYFLRMAMKKAADKVKAISLAALTDSEKNEIRSGIQEALAKVKGDPEVTRAFEKAFQEQIQAFSREFAQETPAFFFIQEEDWKWFIAMQDTTVPFQIIQQDNVGRRKLLLVANPSAIRLLSH